jgi:hypothetical protein
MTSRMAFCISSSSIRSSDTVWVVSCSVTRRESPPIRRLATTARITTTIHAAMVWTRASVGLGAPPVTAQATPSTMANAATRAQTPQTATRGSRRFMWRTFSQLAALKL